MRPIQRQPSSFILEALQVTDQLAKTGRVNAVDSRHIDQDRRHVGREEILEI